MVEVHACSDESETRPCRASSTPMQRSRVSRVRLSCEASSREEGLVGPAGCMTDETGLKRCMHGYTSYTLEDFDPDTPTLACGTAGTTFLNPNATRPGGEGLSPEDCGRFSGIAPCMLLLVASSLLAIATCAACWAHTGPGGRCTCWRAAIGKGGQVQLHDEESSQAAQPDHLQRHTIAGRMASPADSLHSSVTTDAGDATDHTRHHQQRHHHLGSHSLSSASQSSGGAVSPDVPPVPPTQMTSLSADGQHRPRSKAAPLTPLPLL